MSRIDGDWLDFKMKRADERRAEYLARYPTRWKRICHWIGPVPSNVVAVLILIAVFIAWALSI